MSHSETERLAARLLMVGFAGGTVDADVEDLIRRGVRSFVLFRRNAGTSTEVRQLTDHLQRLSSGEALIAVDHEGGSVTRLDGAATHWPSAMACAASGDLRLVEDAWYAGARELACLGINLNLAPVVDLMADYRNPVLGTRVFSDDPQMTASYGAAVVRAHRRAEIGSTAKHFPGHGATPVDSHLELPTVDRTVQELQENDLVPFAAAVEAGVDCLMMSHVWNPNIDPEPTPATFSPRQVHIGRSGLGFEGAILTDCLEMGAVARGMTSGEAVVRAALAGCDLMALSSSVDRQREALAALTRAIESGSLRREQVERSVERIDQLRCGLSGGRAGWPDDGAHLAAALARRAVTVVQDRNRMLPLSLDPSARIGCVSFSLDGGESELVRSLQSRPVDIVEVRVTPEQPVAQAVERVCQSDLIVVATSFATGRPIQAAVVSELARLDRPLVVMAVHDPFDLLSFPEVPCYVAVYGKDRTSIEAGLAVLFGEEPPRGRLPVALPGLYPRGRGLCDGS